MATVVKNFRIKSGLIVEGTTGTINGQNILTESGGDSYILNLVGGATLVKSVDTGVFNVDNAGNLTINNNTFDSYGSASAAQDAAAQDATNKANAALADAQNYANNLASNYDSAGSAASAELAAKNYADGLAGNYDAAGAASTAQSNAELYTDNAISGLSGSGTAVVAGNLDILTGTGIQVNGSNNSVEIDRQTVDTWYDAAGAASTAEQNANLYTDNAVSDLVNSAPAMLDTLGELATALQNNPDIITNLQDVAAGKQDTLTTGNGIVIDNNLIYIPTSIGSGVSITPNTVEIDRTVVDTWYDAAGAASTAQSNAETFATNAANSAQTAAENYANGLASNYDAAGAASTAESNANTYTDNAVNSLTGGTTQFTEVSIGWMSREVAAYSYANSDNQVTAYSWDKLKGASAKFLVRVRNGIHSQVSEILITKDDSNNLAITEYGIVTTNGILGDITAAMNGNNIELKVEAVHTGGTEIIVSGTLMSYGD